jgi:hypothetical protein
MLRRGMATRRQLVGLHLREPRLLASDALLRFRHCSVGKSELCDDIEKHGKAFVVDPLRHKFHRLHNNFANQHDLHARLGTAELPHR